MQANPFQDNSDSDSFGDVCDNCPDNVNPEQLDSDCDGVGNACDGSLNCTDGVDCDDDCDGVYNQDDNCPQIANGLAQGTCVVGYLGQFCLADEHCGPGGICNLNQDDTMPPHGNGIGDACDCEGNFDCDRMWMALMPRFQDRFRKKLISKPLQSGNPCNGDFDCDGDVDGTDAKNLRKISAGVTY